MLKTNTKAPTFNLDSTDGKIYFLKDMKGEADKQNKRAGSMISCNDADRKKI